MKYANTLQKTEKRQKDTKLTNTCIWASIFTAVTIWNWCW